MQKHTQIFTCSIGDKVTDKLTGLAGTVSGLVVYPGGDTWAALEYKHEGELKREWLNMYRLESTPIAARSYG